MSAMNQKGILPVGIEVDGVLHREFELRPQKVRDSIEALQDERAASDESWLGLVMQCRQLVKLGTLSADQITPELLLDLYEVDMQTLMEGAAKLRERLRTFRADSGQAAPSATGAA
jgi:hypothetical protein